MKKSEKTALVEDLAGSFNRASIALVSEYRGMTAAESTEMRKRLRAVRGEMRIAKNTLVRHAIKGTKFEALDSNLGGQVGLILELRGSRRTGEDLHVVRASRRQAETARRRARRQGADPGGSRGAVETAVAGSDFRPVARVAQCAGDTISPPAQRAGLVPGARDRRDWKKERRWRSASSGGFIGTGP